MIIKSIFRYSGSKRRLLPQLLELFPNNINTFYDLFGGSGVVSVNVKSKRVIYSDTFNELPDFFNYLKNNDINDCIKILQDIINKYNLPDTNRFKDLTNDYNNGLIERNPLILLLFNLFEFRGLVRKINGKFTAKCCNKTMKLTDWRIELMSTISNIIKDKDIQFNDNCYSQLDLNSINKDDFIYLDPPYLTTDTSVYSINWSEDDEGKLLDFIQKLIDKDIKFGLSNLIKKGDKVNHQLIKFIQKNKNKIKINILNTKYFLRSKKTQEKTNEVYISNVK